MTLQKNFYIACFWGLKEVCKTLLDTFPNLNVNQALGSIKWTPLHATAFQENGPITLLLLEHNADVDSEDKYGRRPIDFASASEIVWSFFAALNHKRTNKAELNEKQIVTKTQVLNRLNGSVPQTTKQNQIKFAPYEKPHSTKTLQAAYDDDEDDDNQESHVSANGGDVLGFAKSNGNSSNTASSNSRLNNRPTSSFNYLN